MMTVRHIGHVLRRSVAYAVVSSAILTGCFIKSSAGFYRFILENHSKEMVSLGSYGDKPAFAVAPCAIEHSPTSYMAPPLDVPFVVTVTNEVGDVLATYEVVGTMDADLNVPPIKVAYIPRGGSECPPPIRGVYEVVIVNSVSETLPVRYGGEDRGEWQPGETRSVGLIVGSVYDRNADIPEVLDEEGNERMGHGLLGSSEMSNVMGVTPTITITIR